MNTYICSLHVAVYLVLKKIGQCVHLFYRTSNQSIAEQRTAEEELAGEVTTANSRIDEVGTELSSINEQLGEAKVVNLSCHDII